uniref:Uncharacterized protein n=1 Tax=Amphiprion percula TaxID=161767 RepID=A0A3P8T6P9_AMPPE
MCTTMMVLTTIALILRQRFSNKIKPDNPDDIIGVIIYRCFKSPPEPQKMLVSRMNY